MLLCCCGGGSCSLTINIPIPCASTLGGPELFVRAAWATFTLFGPTGATIATRSTFPSPSSTLYAGTFSFAGLSSGTYSVTLSSIVASPVPPRLFAGSTFYQQGFQNSRTFLPATNPYTIALDCSLGNGTAIINTPIDEYIEYFNLTVTGTVGTSGNTASYYMMDDANYPGTRGPFYPGLAGSMYLSSTNAGGNSHSLTLTFYTAGGGASEVVGPIVVSTSPCDVSDPSAVGRTIAVTL